MPANLKLLFLPPYSPELNPQEHGWDELREKCFHNKTPTVWMRWRIT
jgi:transposase